MHESARWFLPRFAQLLTVLLAIAAGSFSSAALAQAATVELEWLTWSFFRFTSPGGKVILTNPFITGNPDAASGVKVEEITDMAMWAEAYKPDAMIFLMHPSAEPQDIGMAVKLVASESPSLAMLTPHHHRISPPAGAPTVEDTRKVLDSMGVRIPITALAPKQAVELSKPASREMTRKPSRSAPTKPASS